MSTPAPTAGLRDIPQNVQAEQSFLGAIMFSNESYHIVAPYLRPEHFYEPLHRRLFSAMAVKIENGKVADPITLADDFVHDPDFVGVDSVKFLANMVRRAETFTKIDDYGRLIQKLALRRQIIAAARDVENRAFEPDMDDDPAAIISDHAVQLELIREGAVDGDQISAMDWALLDSQTPPDRISLVGDGWLPAGYVTALYGPGAAGKSLLTQQLATAVSLGLPWLGLETVKTRTLAIYCEEDDAEIWRRQLAICKAYGIRLKDLQNRLLCQGRNGLESRLVSPGRDGLYTTGFYTHLVRYIKTRRIGFVIIDNRSNVFDGDENNRSQASYTINRFASIAKAAGCTVLLVGHTAKAEGSEYSGNAGWNDHIRARWSFRITDPDKGIRTLARPKSNYGAPNAEMQLKWLDGSLHLHRCADPEEVRANVATARQPIKDAIAQLKRMHLAASHKPRATTFLPRFLHSKALCLDIDQRIIEKAMDQMILDGTLLPDQKLFRDGARKWVYGLARLVDVADDDDGE